MRSPFLWIILLEGFLSVAVEVLAMRQLVPFFGSNTTVASFVIGFFLLFLAIGYATGGKFSASVLFGDDSIKERLYCNFLLAMIIFSIGLSYVFLEFFFSLAGVSHISLSLYLLIAIAPVSFYLGQTMPLMSNYFSAVNFGDANGKILFLSTIGSFLGSIATTTILMRYCGVGLTIAFLLIVFFALLLLVSSLVIKYKRNKIEIFLALVILVSGIVTNYPQHQYFLYANEYANAKILDVDTSSKILLLNDSYSSKTDKIAPEFEHNFEYINLIKRILFAEKKVSNKEILVLGAGGFTLSERLPQNLNNHFVYVDLDRDLKKITEKYFLEHEINGEFIAEDALSYLRKNQKSVDVLLLDVYTNKYTIPKNMLTRESLLLMKSRLKDDGQFIANIIMYPLLNDAYSKSVDDTIRSVFDCSSIVLNKASLYGLNNVIFFCTIPKNKVISTNNKY